jgi:hypothetical protein
VGALQRHIHEHGRFRLEVPGVLTSAIAPGSVGSGATSAIASIRTTSSTTRPITRAPARAISWTAIAATWSPTPSPATTASTLDSKGAIIEVCCNAHARRKFFDARSTDATRSHQALAYYRQLYAVEAEAKELDDDSRWSLRREKSLPLLADFERWLRQQQPQVLPKSPIGEAIAYALNHWTALVRYTEAVSCRWTTTWSSAR